MKVPVIPVVHPDDLTQELLLAAPAAFDLVDPAIGQAEFVEGLMQGCSGLLSLALIAFEALLRVLATALSGFGLFSGVSLG